MLVSPMLSSQAFAKVDSYQVKVGDDVYQYNRVELLTSFLNAQIGQDGSELYNDFAAKMKENGIYAFHDNVKNAYIPYKCVKDAFLASQTDNTRPFKLDIFTESNDVDIIKIPTVKKAVLIDGEVKYYEENYNESGKLKITSIEALNLKQVKIKFNRAVTDEDIIDDIEDEDNYILEDYDEDEVDDVIDEVKLDDSKRFAILTFKDKTDNEDKYIIENQERYTLIIDENVMGKEIKEKIYFKDFELPTVEGVEVVGEDTIKVKFSEPIKPWNLDKINEKDYEYDDVVPELDEYDFEIDEDDITINKVELVNGNTEANIILGTDLKDGQELEVKVKGSIEDYAGLSVISEKRNIEVEKYNKAPHVVGFKDVESNQVTLAFDRDIKFTDSDRNEAYSGDLEDFYHTNRSTTAKSAKIDGKELTLTFDDDDSLPNGTGYIYIKSGALESLWGKENDKITAKIQGNEDDDRPEVTRVKQDEDSARKIKVRFSEKVKTSRNRDDGARNPDNYIIEDEDDKEWRIDKIEQDDDSEKEFIITTRKDLDDELKYTLTVKNIEDKAGNEIRKVTKRFDVSDRNPVSEDDVKVHVYSAGTSKQKIVIDFDEEMTTDNSKYSVKDLGKYSLINGKFDNNKRSVNIEDLYKASIRIINDDKSIEISLPYNKNKDDSYDFTDYDFKNMEISIYRVADVDGNVITLPMRIPVVKPELIGYDTEPEVISPDEIHFIIDDKVYFDNDDIKVVAAKDKEDAYNAAMNKDSKVKDKEAVEFLPVSRWRKNTNKDGNTEVTLILNRELANKDYDDDDYEHILSYDGKRNGKPVFVVVVPSGEDGKTSTENKYDETLMLGAIEVEDSLAPEIIDNGKRTDSAKIGHFRKDGNGNVIKNNDEVVEWTQNGKDGAIVLTFEEDIDEKTLSTATFELYEKHFGYARLDKVYVDKNHKNKVILLLSNLIDEDGDVTIEDGCEIIQNGPFEDMNGNQVDRLRLYVGDFRELETSEVYDFDNILNNAQTIVNKEAKKIKTITPPVKDATKLVLPKVSKGYIIAIKSSSNENVIKKYGTIIPPLTESNVDVTLTVTNITTGKSADITLTVRVPKSTLGEQLAAAKTALNTKLIQANKALEDTSIGEEADRNALQLAIDIAQGIYNTATSTKVQLDKSTEDLNTAITTFNEKVIAAAKTVLNTKLTQANDALINHSEGTSIGKASKSDRDALQAAINIAKGIYDSADSTKAQLDKATEDLNTAINTFNENVIKGAAEFTDVDLLAGTTTAGATSITWGESLPTGATKVMYTIIEETATYDKPVLDSVFDGISEATKNEEITIGVVAGKKVVIVAVDNTTDKKIKAYKVVLLTTTNIKQP